MLLILIIILYYKMRKRIENLDIGTTHIYDLDSSNIYNIYVKNNLIDIYNVKKKNNNKKCN